MILLSNFIVVVRKDVASLLEGPTQMVERLTVPKEIFIVPYKRNVHFTGREKLIATLNMHAAIRHCTEAVEPSSCVIRARWYRQDATRIGVRVFPQGGLPTGFLD